MAIRLSGMNSGLDTDAIVQELVSAYSLKTEKYEKEQTKLEWKQDAWKSLNSKIYGLYTNISNLRYSTAYNMKKTTVSDATKAKVTAASGAVIGTQTLSVNKMAQSAYLTGAKLSSGGDDKIKGSTKVSNLLADVSRNTEGKVEIKVNNKTIEIDENTTVSNFVTKLKEAGVNVSFDENNQRFFISAKESGAGANFTISDNTGNNTALKALGLYTYGTELGGATFEDAKKEYNQLLIENGITEDNVENSDNSRLKELKNILKNAAVKIDGSDAEITLNGATYTSSSNSFSINGLTIEAMGVTDANNPLSITTATDTQGLYDKIKDFLTEYNNVMNEMTKLYNADSAGDYQPLTDEEKEAMSESEIEKWETKIKDSLLRRDGTVSSLMSGMINAMSQSIVVGGDPVIVDGKTKTDAYGNPVYAPDTGKKLTLSYFGIQTLGFLNAAKNEQNAYHIDGDEDDANTSGKTDKLMSAIQNNPDEVCEFMQSLAKRLYTTIDNKMKSTSLSSAYKVYNDKEMDSELRDYKKLISEWEEKVSKKEEYYTQKFAAMETALAKLQSQSSSFSGLLGS